MRKLLCTLMLATLGTAAAKADSVTITFDQPTETGTAGQTLEFFGTIVNDSNTTIYLNNDDLNSAARASPPSTSSSTRCQSRSLPAARPATLPAISSSSTLA